MSFKTNQIISTTGKGLWSSVSKPVRVIGLDLAYVDEEDFGFGELRVEFDTRTWDTDSDGLIYTDSGFLKGLRLYLNQLGLAGSDVDYSEQGMQGEDYVSLDVGGEFISTFHDLLKSTSVKV